MNEEYFLQEIHRVLRWILGFSVGGWMLLLAIFILLATSGCASTPTPQEVIPCTPVMVYSPEIPQAPRPALTSARWTREQVASAPVSFAEALARDLAEWIGWGLGMEADITASNEARPHGSLQD